MMQASRRPVPRRVLPCVWPHQVIFSVRADIEAGDHLRAVRAALGGVGPRGLQRHRLRLWTDRLRQDLYHGPALSPLPLAFNQGE